MAPQPDARTEGRMNLIRALARALVIAGGAFWVIAAFVGPYVFSTMTLSDSARTMVWPFLTTVLVLVLGWKHEQLAAVILSAAAAAVFVWGVIYGWNAGTWLFMSGVIIIPMVLAAVLFVVSARTGERPSAG
jgi:peptidoglycan/LPS O-acetylase OafA/YrhL